MSGELSVEWTGQGPPVVFVHGSVIPGAATWQKQRSLAQRWTLIVPDRPGFGEGQANGRVDFERDREALRPLLGAGAHLVGHSYGGVVALLLAAGAASRVRSLTLIEPASYSLARADPLVEQLVAQIGAHLRGGPVDSEAFLRGFAELLHIPLPRGELPAPLLEGAELLRAERPPWEATIDLDPIRRAPVPTLVVSGGHHPALEAVCDVVQHRLRAQRAVVPGSGHSIPRTGARFNRRLDLFLQYVESQRRAARAS